MDRNASNENLTVIMVTHLTDFNLEAAVPNLGAILDLELEDFLTPLTHLSWDAYLNLSFENIAKYP